MKIKISKYKIIFLLTILVILLLVFNSRNIYEVLPLKYKISLKNFSIERYEGLSDQNKIILRALNIDPFKSLNTRYLRNYPAINNLNNDYNVKFLPKTQYQNFEINIFKVNLREGRTLHHDILEKDGAGKVLLRSAPSGTGIIAGGAIRAACEVVGIQDIVAKSLGSSNPITGLRACLKAFKNQSSPKSISKLRGKNISEIVKKKERK